MFLPHRAVFNSLQPGREAEGGGEGEECKFCALRSYVHMEGSMLRAYPPWWASI